PDFAEWLKWKASLFQDRHRLLQVFRRDRNHDPRLRFVKENFFCGNRRAACIAAGMAAATVSEINFSSKSLLRIETAFRDRNREAAFAAIVGAFHQAGANQIAHGILNLDLMGKIDMRRWAELFAVANF